MRTRWVVACTITATLIGVGIGYNLPDGNLAGIQFDERPEAGFSDLQGIPATNVARARRVAQKIWGPACHNQVHIGFAHLPRGQSGSASYTYEPQHPNDTRRYDSCVIVVNESIRFAPGYFCAVVSHEWGHLVGESHTRNPTTLMYPRLSSRNVPRSCRHG